MQRGGLLSRHGTWPRQRRNSSDFTDGAPSYNLRSYSRILGTSRDRARRMVERRPAATTRRQGEGARVAAVPNGVREGRALIVKSAISLFECARIEIRHNASERQLTVCDG